MLKALHPKGYFVVGDLLTDCVKHAVNWERLLGATLDEKWAFNSRDMPFADAQFDTIFTFAAFHHFGENGNYDRALAEMLRVLKPGGKIVLLYEPASPPFFYKSAFKRVNRRREVDGVDEDVLVCSKLKQITDRLGCTFEPEMYPFFRHRDGVASTNYYFLLSKLGPLRKHFVCTINVKIRKQK